MTLTEQIQIVEDNLNEYGQSNITFEEYNFLKDELYSSGCIAGIELGRTEAIEECIKFIKEHSGDHYIDCDGYFGGKTELAFIVDDWIDDLEQLKEQK